AMAPRRPRPRWKTALVEAQNLRWFRTTLLGRMPGWSPAVPPVGPWQPIVLECADALELSELSLQARAEGGIGHLRVSAAVARTEAAAVESARLVLAGVAHA